MKFIIQYTLPYEHRVMVGIEAESPEAAIAKAGELFDQGDIWNDTEQMPLLFDDFEEMADADVPLEFTIEGEVIGDWPEADASVKALRRQNAVQTAARLLAQAYQRGEANGDHIDWEDLDQAYQAALAAIKPDAPCLELNVVNQETKQ